MSFVFCQGQDINDFQSFREELRGNFAIERLHYKDRFNNFRDSVNAEYAKFLGEAWKDFKSMEPISRPKDKTPVAPQPYEDDKDTKEPVTINRPMVVKPQPKEPQPEPIAPVKVVTPTPTMTVNLDFYGLQPSVRVPVQSGLKTLNATPQTISDAWSTLSGECWDATLQDCLDIRTRHKLSDWAYLQLLDTVATKVTRNKNDATLLRAFLFCQSGYKMRLGRSGDSLVMLFGCREQICDVPFFRIDGGMFYPYGDEPRSLSICDVAFKGEKSMSLIIHEEQQLGGGLTDPRTIMSRKYPEISVASRVPAALIEFYNTYPAFLTGNNPLSQWVNYAECPLADATKQNLYPILRAKLAGDSKAVAAGKLLNWVQTGLKYATDEQVWGYERPFFGEETLFYPYSDCEDRAVLYAILVRDLVGLDVALVYYPGHLATAVNFDTEVGGDSVNIDGRSFTICDPTYIGAGIGKQMPGLNYDKVEVLLLGKRGS